MGAVIIILLIAAETAAKASSTNILVVVAQIVALVIGILGSAAFVVAFLRSNLAQSTIKLQSEQITAQAQRIETLEADAKRIQEEASLTGQKYLQTIDELKSRITSLESAIKVLENMKSGSDAVEKLANVSAEIASVNIKKLDEILEIIKKD